MIPVAFSLTPAGALGDLEIDGVPFEGWASAEYCEAPEESAVGGPHLVVELPIERFTPGPGGLLLWIGETAYTVDLGQTTVPAGGVLAGDGGRRAGMLPVMILVRCQGRDLAGRLVAPAANSPGGVEPGDTPFSMTGHLVP
ncbi:MAG: hypothetical protein GXY82_03515 [Methanospirillum sp.]|nr:hypothetical protein [Methanospirillum sp.]